MLNCGDGAQMPTADDHLMGDRNYENRKGRKQKRVNIRDAVKRHEVGESLPARKGTRAETRGTLGPPGRWTVSAYCTVITYSLG